MGKVKLVTAKLVKQANKQETMKWMRIREWDTEALKDPLWIKALWEGY